MKVLVPWVSLMVVSALVALFDRDMVTMTLLLQTIGPWQWNLEVHLILIGTW